MSDHTKPEHNVGVRLQTLPAQDQTIALARLAEARVGGAFGSNVIRCLYVEMSLPVPTNVSDVIGKLAKKGLMIQVGSNPVVWRLTPLGRRRSQDLMSDIDLAAVAAEAAASGAAIFGRSAHSLLPPTLAPLDLIPTLHQFLAKFPFETNIFAMTRFPEEGSDEIDPIASALQAAAHACIFFSLFLSLCIDLYMLFYLSIHGCAFSSRLA